MNRRGGQQPRRRLLALRIVSAALVVACARNAPPADSLPSATLIKDTTLFSTFVRDNLANVFTDTALFRKVCAEADSGLTAKTAGKCTPRDQSRRLGPRPRPREP